MKALSSLMFIFENHDGRVKAQKCVVGSKQMTFPGYVKSDGALPTVTTDGFIKTSTIEAHEVCDVVVADLSNSFLNVYNCGKTLMLLKEMIEELMVHIDPQIY